MRSETGNPSRLFPLRPHLKPNLSTVVYESLVSHLGLDITNSGAILTIPHVGTHERHESFYDWDFIQRYLDSNGRPKPQIECVSAPLAFCLDVRLL